MNLATLIIFTLFITTITILEARTTQGGDKTYKGGYSAEYSEKNNYNGRVRVDKYNGDRDGRRGRHNEGVRGNNDEEHGKPRGGSRSHGSRREREDDHGRNKNGRERVSTKTVKSSRKEGDNFIVQEKTEVITKPSSESPEKKLQQESSKPKEENPKPRDEHRVESTKPREDNSKPREDNNPKPREENSKPREENPKPKPTEEPPKKPSEVAPKNLPEVTKKTTNTSLVIVTQTKGEKKGLGVSVKDREFISKEVVTVTKGNETIESNTTVVSKVVESTQPEHWVLGVAIGVPIGIIGLLVTLITIVLATRRRRNHTVVKKKETITVLDSPEERDEDIDTV